MAKETRVINVYGIKKTQFEQNTYYKVVVGIECDEDDNERGLYGHQFAEVKAEEAAFNAVAEQGIFPCKCEATVSVTFAKSGNEIVPRERIKDLKVLTPQSPSSKKSAA